MPLRTILTENKWTVVSRNTQSAEAADRSPNRVFFTVEIISSPRFDHDARLQSHGCHGCSNGPRAQ